MRLDTADMELEDLLCLPHESGRSSVVELLPSKQDVAGSNPAGRSRNEDCKAVYFAGSHEEFECVYCKTGIVKMNDDQAIEYFKEVLAWPDHPTISC